MACVAFFVSCKKENSKDLINSYPVEVRDIVWLFAKEGTDRGRNISFTKLKKIILQGPISGVYSSGGNAAKAYYSHHDKTIYFDTTAHDFKLNREVLVFHELGHAVLRRGHINVKLSNGEQASIMHSEALPDYRYTFAFKRQYYIDELFLGIQYIPDWAK